MFGPAGAGILVIVMAVIGLALASRVIHSAELVWIQGGLILMLSLSAAFFSLYRTALGAKAYRTVGSLYIILFYLSIIVASGVF